MIITILAEYRSGSTNLAKWFGLNSDFTVLVENRLATKNEVVKILGRGELKAKLKVTAHKFTATAKAAIEAAGGEAVTL
jgi:ribosomal protein L15